MNKIFQAEQVLLWFKQVLTNAPLCEKLKKIKFMVTDVDGCLTNNNITLMDSLDEGKDFSIQDGYAIKQSVEKGLLQIALLTGRVSESTRARAARIKILPELCVMGVVEEKEATVIKMQHDFNFTKEETLFFGDAVQDYKVRSVVGLSAAPANAVFYVHQAADVKLPLKGGHGAMRLLIDLILYLQNKHFAQELITAALAEK